MSTLATILARAGSKQVPDKCVLPLCGQPVIMYTISHALQSRRVNEIVLSTDSARAAAFARSAGVAVIDRPPELASDTARVDDCLRHAVTQYEAVTDESADVVVCLYANVPVRADGIIDRCVDHLITTGCDSVRTVAPVGKYHPDWMHRLDGDRMQPLRPNSIHRRQDLEPVYHHDGAVVAVRRACLFSPETRDDPHAFFGQDRRAVVQNEEDTAEIDTLVDFYRAEAILRLRSEALFMDRPSGGSRRPVFTGAVHCGASHER